MYIENWEEFHYLSMHPWTQSINVAYFLSILKVESLIILCILIADNIGLQLHNHYSKLSLHVLAVCISILNQIFNFHINKTLHWNFIKSIDQMGRSFGFPTYAIMLPVDREKIIFVFHTSIFISWLTAIARAFNIMLHR